MTGPDPASGAADGPAGISRRQLLRHMAWFDAAVVLAVTGGEVISHSGTSSAAVTADPHVLRFVQVGDSHIGFVGPVNTEVTGSFSRAIDQVNNRGFRPDFVMHTGDLTHLSTPGQLDQVHQMMRGLRTGQVFTVPGEHAKTENNVTFCSATTAYSLPHPGVGPGPIPVTLPAGQLGAALGIRDVTYQPGQHTSAIRDHPLADRKPS
jgi:hypothetical protein